MNRRTASKMLLAGAAGLHPAFAQRLPMAKPQFSCMLWTLEPHRSFDQCLEIVANAGYGGVELVGEFHKWSPGETTRIQQRLRSLSLVVDAASGVQAGFAVPAERDAFLQQCKAQLASMQELGCRRLILLSGPVVKELSPEQQRSEALEGLRRACDLAADAGVEVLIEPIDPLENPTIFLRGVTEAFSMVTELKRPNLKVLYDLYHEQRSGGNLLEKLNDHIDLVGLVHVADVPGRHEPGTGEIRYEAVYQALAAHRYAGWIAMEFMPIADPTAALRKARSEVLRAYSS